MCPPFICPLCHAPLQIQDKYWFCVNPYPDSKTHSFDTAKQGYINLLPVQHKKSKSPGDSEQSIHARQQFLQAGYYQKFADSLIEQCSLRLNQNALWQHSSHTIWLDVGCGDGYYTRQFLSLHPATLIALDISKPAVIATVKRLKLAELSARTYCLVASASQMPLAENSVTMLTSIFSPILPTEFARVLQSGGLVVIAKPAENHLLELRQALFDSVELHNSDKFIEQMAQDFRLIAQEKIDYLIEVDEPALTQLMTMTPYAYRAKAHKREALLEKVKIAGKMTLNLSFYGYFFQKN